jgi:hypothetical protein
VAKHKHDLKVVRNHPERHTIRFYCVKCRTFSLVGRREIQMMFAGTFPYTREIMGTDPAEWVRSWRYCRGG